MKFVLTLYRDPPWDDRDHEEFLTAAREAGELVGVLVPADPSTSAVVRVRGGVTTVTDGPYLDTGDQAGAHYLLDCDDRDRAVELAGLLPARAVEVRPLMGAAGMEM
ncbi:YciI family protein [Actinomadura fulvescens]|uniref:YCII-related domain-containing protein n=1 Tax=Actinomadura fulvescens TaxID=46160 RepID=A0ABN3QW54_9ACTN